MAQIIPVNGGGGNGGGGSGDMLKSVYDPNNKNANAFDYNNFINTPTIPNVINNLTSLSTTDALSAAQGKALKDAIDNISGLGKFLSLWNSATGQPISFPLATPYTYTTGDWFMVETVGTTNYKPTGSSYTGAASTVVESGTVKQGDVYIYDGTDWLLQVNNEPQVSFSEIAGQPTDNTNLATALNTKQNTLTAGANIKIASNVISANNMFIITEDIVTVSRTAEKGVAPYNTNYYYTNIDIDANAGIEWREGAAYKFVIDTEMVVTSSYRNVRVRIGNGAYIPVMGQSNAILAGNTYFTKARNDFYIYKTVYESGGALHLIDGTNTTYSAMSVAEIDAGTSTTSRLLTPERLKYAIETWNKVQSVNGQTGDVVLTIPTVSDTAYGSSWNGVTGIAPSKNAVYDKINSMDTAIGSNTTAISTINGKIPSAATSSNQLADKDYVNDGINSVTAYYITKDAQGNQWATRAELFAATTFYSGGVARVPTKNDYTIVLADEQHDNATTRYIYNNGWEYQYTVNETAMTQAQLNAINSGITAAKVSTYDGYAGTIAGKQDTLTPSTGISISNNTISNTLPFSGTNGGVKVFNIPSVNDNISGILNWISTGGCCMLKSGDYYYTLQSTAEVANELLFECPDVAGGLRVMYVFISYDNSNIVTQVDEDGRAINEFSPNNSGNTNQVLTKTASGYEWKTPSGGDVMVSSQSGNILTSGMKIWAGTEADYGNLGSYDSNTVYLTI